MDFSKKTPSPNSRFGIVNSNPSDSQRRNISTDFTQEADENSGHVPKVLGLRSRNPGKGIGNLNPSTSSAISKKKILAEKNDSSFSDSGHLDAHSRVMPLCSNVSNSGDRSAISSGHPQLAPYDPLTNYTSPRPEFLRYNPNRRQEILQRFEGELKKEEEGSGANGSSSSDSKKTATEESPSVSSTPLQTSFQDKVAQESEEDVSDAEDDDTQEEEMEVRSRYSRIGRRLLLLLGVLLPSFLYITFMNYASVPSLKEYGGLEDNYQMIQDGGLHQRPHNLNKFPANFWGILLGLSNECLDIHSREIRCAIDGFKRECSEDKDSEEGISVIHLNNLSEGEKLNADMLTLEDIARKDASEYKESFDGTELVTERDGHTLLENGTLRGIDLVAEEMIKKVVSSDEIEQEACNGGNTKAVKDAGSENVEILEAESVSETKLLAIGSSVGQHAHDLCGSFEPRKDFGEEAQVMVNSEFGESLHVPPSKIVSSISSHNPKPEESEIPSTSAIGLKRDRLSLFASKYVLQLLYILICLSVIIGFNGLHKYFPKFHKISAPASHISPALKPALEFALEKKNSSLVSAKQEVENKGSDSAIYKMPLTLSNDEQMKFTQSNDAQMEFNRVQPPTVELLAEFSVVDGTVSGKVSGQKVGRKLADPAEESQFSQSQKKTSVKKNLLSSANKVYPSLSVSSSAAESISSGNSTVQKLQRKKDAGDREDVVKVVATPLRRSSRLRNRVTTP